MEAKLITEGHHRFLEGSTKTQVQAHTFYAHEKELRVIRYENNTLIGNHLFHEIAVMRDWLAAEIYKVEMTNKLIPNHNFDVKTILVLNSNLNDRAGNKVRFFEVVELVDVCNVRLREVKQEVFLHANFCTAIPRVGLYEDEKIVQHKVVANSIKMGEGQLAVALQYELVMIAGVIPLKVYKPISFGIKA